MENPQAQMPQGQPGPAPEQMQQGQGQAPQQGGGQDQQMQQIMQLVQQMMQQGIQPVEAAAELLSKQVPPEMIMQVFVQLGMPQESAQQAIEQAMQGGQQPQNAGEEQMEGQASNPQEETAEQQQPDQSADEPDPAMQQLQMAYGGKMPRRLKKFGQGGANAELQGVLQQVQEMMQQGSDARQVMAQIQQAAQQGQISPETAAVVMEQLGGMQQAENPQGDDATMTAQSQDPQVADPNMAAPDQQMGMARFGGNLKSLLKKAYGGPMTPPAIESKDYARDRTSMFVNAVKNSAYKSTLDDEFPSLSGNQMAYGGIPKAAGGIEMKDGKLSINPSSYKSDVEYKAAIADWNLNPANKDNQITNEHFTANPWKAPEPTYQAGKNYQYDPNTKSWTEAKPATQGFNFQAGDVLGQDAQGHYVTRADGSMQRIPGMANNNYNIGYGATNPVAYQNPMGNGLYGNLYAGASPFARMVSGFSMDRGYDPRITGANLPGGMSAEQFLGTVGPNGLVPGMAGTAAGQNWRVGEAEKFKEGSIWKGNRRKGVRYQIDWGMPGATNAQTTTTTTPAAVATVNPQAATTTNPSATPSTVLGTMPATGGSGMGAMERMDAVDLNGAPQSNTTTTTQPSKNAANPFVVNTRNFANPDSEEFASLTGPATQPGAANTADQTLINPANTNVINPSTEVNAVDQSVTTGAGDYPFVDLSNIDQQTTPFTATYTPEQIAAANQKAQEGSDALNQVVSGVKAEEGRNAVRNAMNFAEEQRRKAEEERKKQTPVQPTSPYPYIGPNADSKDFERYRVQALQAAGQYARSKGWSSSNVKFDDKTGQVIYGPGQVWDPTEQKFTSNPNMSYGGGINHNDLSNAIALINRAFGGMIPMADNGLNLGSEDVDANKIPDYLQFENLPKTGTIEQSAGKKLNINWNQVGSAAGDMYMNGATKATNFFNKMHDYNPARDQAKYSALNRPSDTYDTMSQGLYDQAGNFITNDVGDEVLNNTNTNYNNQRQIFAYGGRLYEIGGEVDLTDDELQALSQAGLKFSRV